MDGAASAGAAAAGRSGGIPAEAFEFYERLTADNTKAFWQANKQTYTDAVKTPILQLCAALADFGTFHVFRPYNDVRFAKGRPPYKDHQGAYTEGDGGTGFYFHLGATEVMVGAGYYTMRSDQLERFREAIDDDARGGELAKLVAAAEKKGFRPSAMDVLKTAPRGYAKDHPRIELLRRKGLILGKTWSVEPWMHTSKLVTTVRSTWKAMAPVTGWLDTHVGPSLLEPEEGRFF